MSEKQKDSPANNFQEKVEKRLEELTKEREGFLAEHESAKRAVNVAMQKIIAISGGIQELEGLLRDSVSFGKPG